MLFCLTKALSTSAHEKVISKETLSSLIEKQVYKISINDPIKKDEVHKELRLVKEKDKKGIYGQYYLDVSSVYCLENVCKVVPVRMFWDIFGNYQKFHIKSQYKLEKNKGIPFSQNDYQKLHEILLDENSQFRLISINEIVKPNSKDEVDAVSGATAIELSEKTTIKGATLTSYTLWHWAHGELGDIIRNISGDNLAIPDLRNFLYEDDSKKEYAIEQITRRRIYDQETIDNILNQSTYDNRSWSKLQLAYFEQANDSIYFSSMLKLFQTCDHDKNLASLNSLIQTSRVAPVNYFDKLCTHPPEMNFYQLVDLFFSLLETKNNGSIVIIEFAFEFLEKDIFIARRAFRFLKTQDLTKKQESKLATFYEQHRDYIY
jgi:hypothetical protein